jgi:hypothetical protein
VNHILWGGHERDYKARIWTVRYSPLTKKSPPSHCGDFSIAHTVQISLRIDPGIDTQSIDAGDSHPHPIDKSWVGCENQDGPENPQLTGC